MKYIVAVIVLIALIVLSGWIASEFIWPPAPGEPPGLGTDLPANPVALGWLEPAAGVVEISGTPGEKLASLSVHESDVAKKGDVLARMQSYGIRSAEVTLIKSQIEEAKARLAGEKQLAEAKVVSAELGIEKALMQDLDIESLKQKIELLKMKCEQVHRDYARLKRLHGEGSDLVSQQELEGQELLVGQASAELAAAKTNLEKLDRTRELAAKAAQADLDAARAGLKQIEASSTLKSLQTQLEIAEARLALTEIVAPREGTVLKVFMEPGESIGQKPILQLADLTQMVAVAEVHENVVRWIREGQRAIIKSKAFPAPYDTEGLDGRVDRIGRMIITPELKSLDPFARADRHVVTVRIIIDGKAHNRVAADFTNLQVEIAFPSARLRAGPNPRRSQAVGR